MIGVYCGTLIPTKVALLYKNLVSEDGKYKIEGIDINIINEDTSILGVSVGKYVDYIAWSPEFSKNVDVILKSEELKKNVMDFLKIWNDLYENVIKKNEENHERFKIPEILGLTLIIVSSC